jgi:serine/threonine protein kinase
MEWNNSNTSESTNGGGGGRKIHADNIPMFAVSELNVGRMVGQGGFSLVTTLESVELNDVYDVSEKSTQLRRQFAESVRNSSDPLSEPAYVVKTLRTDLPEEEYVKGIVDLDIEAEFLSVLSHPNIITMRACANSDPHESKFFVVLDRLVMTLDRKFNHWRKEVGEHSGYWLGPFGYCCSKEYYLYQTWLERIFASRDIANALYFLHSKKIVYRDLKPDNLGFDSNGTLKLFDFGLAKRMDPAQKNENGMYLMTGNTGSLRYMAPECAKNEPYDQRVDSYSFGILFWQICSLQTPYAGMSTRAHAQRVVQQGQRPKPDKSWPSSWVDLMTRCWDSNVSSRPDFDEISAFLNRQTEQIENNEGEVPSRASEIKAKMKNRPTVTERLDVDTRKSTTDDGPNFKKFDQEVV